MMRTNQHIIDTKSIKQTLNSIPDHWVVRELTERDYGIDLMVEIFVESGSDVHGHPTYDATGRVCYLQVKGTNNPLTENADKSISFGVEKKALMYVEKFPLPFLLIRVCILDGKEEVRFLWMQRYIKEVLDKEHPNWRTDKQETFSMRIPPQNTLPANSAKIEKIAARMKYIEEAAEFFEIYSLLTPLFMGMFNKPLSNELYESVIADLHRIKKLSTLLNNNNAQVNANDIEELIRYIQEVQQGEEKPESINDFPDPVMFNLDLLLNDNFLRTGMEQLIAENAGDTTY